MDCPQDKCYDVYPAHAGCCIECENFKSCVGICDFLTKDQECKYAEAEEE